MTDQAELIARVRRGESQAFNSLVKPYLPRAYRTAYLITHDPHSASEALKQASQGRRVAYGPIPEQPELTTPESALLDQEERECLWQAVQKLSPDHRAVIVRRYYEEMSEADMAGLVTLPGSAPPASGR